MKPLITASFYMGLCPIGDPPTYKPKRRTVVLGVLASTGSIAFVVGMLAAEALRDDERGGTAMLSDSVRQSETLVTVIVVCNGANLLVSNVGLLIGHFRKKRHLPRVFQMSDSLPGKARWRQAVFVAELSVFSVPVCTYLLRAIREEDPRISHTEEFSMLILLYSLEKFMLLHLVARVGTGFDSVNRRLENLRGAASGQGDAGDALRLLRQQHMQLCELLELVTRSYEVQILTALVGEFILSVLGLYVQARNLYMQMMEVQDILALVILALVTQLTTLTSATCRATSAKGNHTADLVHRLLNTRKFTAEESQELVFFSMQTVCRKISVSPYDVVTLDYALISAMAGSVAMHIVILIQFNLSRLA